MHAAQVWQAFPGERTFLGDNGAARKLPSELTAKWQAARKAAHEYFAGTDDMCVRFFLDVMLRRRQCLEQIDATFAIEFAVLNHCVAEHGPLQLQKELLKLLPSATFRADAAEVDALISNLLNGPLSQALD